MRKFVKFCLIAGTSLLVSGIVLAGVVMLLGGFDAFASVNSRGQRYFNVLDHVAEALPNNRFYNDLVVNGERKSDGSLSADVQLAAGIAKLDIEAGVGNFKVLPWDNDYARIEISGYGECRYYQRGDTFYVEGFDTDNGWWRWTNYSSRFADNEMALYLPRHQFSEQISLDVGTGTLEIKDFSTKVLDGEVGVGKLYMDNIATHRLDLETGVGTASFNGTISGNVNAECGVGNITLVIKGNENDFNYNIDCSIGNVSVGGRSYSGLGSSQIVNNGSDKSMRLECAVGNIKVRFVE
jgi:hypothetical protein